MMGIFRRRFDYEVWSDEKLIGEGWNHTAPALKRFFEEYTKELNSSTVGDGFSFIVRRAK
jgi:hypothetical protein